MISMRIDDARICVYHHAGDVYIVPVFREEEDTPFKTLALTERCLNYFLEACAYVSVRQKMPVSQYIGGLRA